MLSRHSTSASRIRALNNVQQDRQLVDRCLAGQPGAWDQLYTEVHTGLLVAIRRQLGARSSDPNLVDEIAARVWYALVADGGWRLDAFDASRGCRLSTYLATLARSEASGFFRAERRRRQRERLASRPERTWDDQLGGLSREELREFVRRLTPREREFLCGYLLCPVGQRTRAEFSDTNRWQLACRVHAKLNRLLLGPQRSSTDQ